MIAAGLALLGTLVFGGCLGWWFHDQHPGPPEVNVSRPVRVLSESEGASGAVPNVIGLDLDTARRAVSDAGLDPGTIRTRGRPYAGQSGLVVDQQPSPGTSHPAAVTLGVSSPATMPSLAGPVADARRRLSDLGARVVLATRFEPGVAEGTVVASHPAAGQKLTDDVTLTVAEAPSSVFATNLEPVTSDCDTGSLTMNGHSFDNVVSCAPSQDSPSAVEYALNRRVKGFSATIGLDDRGGTGFPVRYRVLVDGSQVFSRTLSFGQTAPVSVRVAGALRLKLQARLARRGEPNETVTAGWGEARFLGGRSAIDALARSSSP